MSVSSPRPEPPLLIPKMINTALDRHIHHPCSRKQDFCWQQVQCVQKLIDDTETLMFVTTRNFSEGWLSALWLHFSWQFPCCFWLLFCADLRHNYLLEHNNLQAHLQHHLFRPEPLIKYNWSITRQGWKYCWKGSLLCSLKTRFTPKQVP